MEGSSRCELKNSFLIGGSSSEVVLDESKLTWQSSKNGATSCVRMEDLLAVEQMDNESPDSVLSGCAWNKERRQSDYYLTVYYVQEGRNNRVSIKSIKLIHTSLDVIEEWNRQIGDQLQSLSRPRRLLFILNPFGGKKIARKLFDKEVAPLLDLCKVQWTLKVTEHSNHAYEILSSTSESDYLQLDAVVAVGGDGTISEIVTGLLRTNCKNVTASNLEASPLPIGIIPAGSSNATCFSIYGTEDPKTALIHIITGSTKALDVAAVHGNCGIDRFIVGQLSYGYLGDTLDYSENFRWMGPKRYDYAGLRKFLQNKAYAGSIDVKICSLGSEPPSCCENVCSECSNVDSLDRKEQWHRIDGTFFGISAANISCKCARSPRGMAPFAHLSNGLIELLLIRKASRVNVLRYLLRTAGDSRQAAMLPYVEKYSTREFVFTPFLRRASPMMLPRMDAHSMSLPSSKLKKQQHQSVWNCDGELFLPPRIRVTAHRNLVQVLSRTGQSVEN